MGKQSTPTPPDPAATAAAQTSSNLATAKSNAELNRVNTNTPYGSLNYTTTGTNPDGIPQYQADLTLSPDQQQLLSTGNANKIALSNTAGGMLNQIGQTYGQPANFDSTIAPEIQKAQDAAYHSQTQYLDPQFQQAEDAQRTRLANQGVASGSQAETTANDNLARQKQAAYTGARDQATTAGQSEQARLFQQLYSLRELPLNEYSALTSGSQVQNPNIPNVPGVTNANTNVAGIYNDAFQNQLAAANYGNQGINNMFSLAGDLGSAAILKSDRRLKRDIKPMGTINGFNAYLFRYLDSDQQYLGVMADEVLKIKPEAVIVGDDGYMSVNYGMLS